MADYSGTYYLANGYRQDTKNWETPSKPVYRLYCDTQGEGYHYWTTDWGEYVRLGSAWHKEGIGFWTSASADTPVYRLYNPNTSQHMYTTSKSEYNNVVAAGWNGEGEVFKVDSKGDWPVYRLYNPNSGEHLFTASESERDNVKAAGWNDEGVAFYCYGLPTLDTSVDKWSYDMTARVGLLGYKDAQLFTLRKESDGYYTLISHYSNLVVSHLANGEVGESHGTSTARSQWSVADLGAATVDSQQCIIVRLVNRETGRALALGGHTVGSAATAEPVGDAWDQRWALVPWRLFQNRGLYELRLMSNTNMALDVTQGNPANGTNVMVHPAGGGNNQKFYLHDNGNGWSLRDISSGKMVDVAGGAISTGTNVQIYADNGTRAQRWRITEHGTAWVNGQQCQVVTLGAGNSTDHLMVAEANASDANVSLGDGTATDHSSWALLPTTAVDNNVPVPSPPNLSSELWRNESGDRAYQERLWPSWTCTDAWMVGVNSYQLRWRIRYMRMFAQSWGAWGGWNEARSEFASRGNTTWYQPGIDTSFDTKIYKACQVEMWVRVQGADGAESIVGRWATSLVSNIVVPEVTIGKAGWSFEGLRIAFASSHHGGRTYIYVTGVEDERGRNLLTGSAAGDSGTWGDDDGSVIIPWKQLAAFNRLIGERLNIKYQKGTELKPRWSWRAWSGSTTVSDNTGTADIGRVRYQIGKGRTLVITAKSLGQARCDLVTSDGDPIECYGPTRNGDGSVSFVAEPPFSMSGYTISYMTSDSEGDKWAVRMVNVASFDMHPCHAFDWTLAGERRHVLLELRKDDKLSESHDIKPDYDEVQLRGRRNHSVKYAGTRGHPIQAVGAFVEEDTEIANGNEAVSMLNELESVGHVHYRAPSGWEYEVAITSLSYEINDTYTEVQVSMVEESR